jgi:hypothetical protein
MPCDQSELPLQSPDGERIPMIKLKEATPQLQADPVEGLALTIAMMAQHRKLLAKAVGSVSDWSVLLEDLEMLAEERVIVGLRTHWARRVAVPVIHAYRALQSTDGSPQERARKALDVLRQCSDVAVQTVLSEYIRETYHVAP